VLAMCNVVALVIMLIARFPTRPMEHAASPA
jgi:hypothetical protein